MRSPLPLSLVVLLTACDATNATADDTADTSADGLRTLANCGTAVADDVPAFFRELYRCVDVDLAGDNVAVTTVNLPPHPSAYYEDDDPNHVAFDDRGGTHFQNPNRIAEQAITVTIPLAPTAKGITVTADMVDLSVGTNDEEYGLGTAGVALDGTALFNAVAGPGDDIDDEAFTFDSYEAHPEQRGSYHYHSATPGPLEILVDAGWSTTSTPGAAEIEVYGVMCDGTVVLGCTELNGSEPDAADFDAQGGHVHDLTGADGTVYFEGRYHTHICTGAYDHLYTPEIQYYEGCETGRP